MAGIDQKTLWDFARIVLKGVSDRQQSQSVRAKFLRTDPDGTQWVQLAGSSEETPVNGRTLASAQAGDTVELEIRDGVLSLDGNASEPSVGMRSAKTVANEAAEGARRMAADAGRAAGLSKQIADAAQQVADAVNQHFFSDTSGIHVTAATQDDWNSNHTGANVLINALGQLFRDGLNNLLALVGGSNPGVAIYDGNGNDAENVVASFTGTEVSLGANSNSSTIDMCGGAFKFSIDASDPNNVTGLIKVDQNAIDDHTANTPSILIAAGTSTLGRGIEIRGTSGAQYPVSIGEYDHGSIAQHVGLGSLGVKTPGIFFDGEGTVEAYSGLYVQSLTGTNFWSTVPGTVLWSGTYYMTESHTANLAYNISTCPTGIVLHFQPYTSSTLRDYNHVYYFVPKVHSLGISVPIAAPKFSSVATKYLYVYDNRIVGHADNIATGTSNGITYNNGAWVMTQVIAV